MIRTWGVFAAAVITAATAVAQGPEPQPQFRSGVDVLSLDVSALDGNRRPVLDLVESDFTVQIGGKKRPIVAFTRVDLPSVEMPRVGWLRDVHPDVVANTTVADGRMLIMLFDQSLAPGTVPAAQQVARAVVDDMGPADLGAVVFVGRARPQNFTTDRSRLLEAINQPFVGFQPGSQTGRCYCGTCPLEAVTQIANTVRDIPQRRKELILLGTSAEFQGIGECFLPMKDAREAMFLALDRSHVTVHYIDAAALQTTQVLADFQGVPRARVTGAESKRQLGLGTLPERTGGRVVLNANALASFVPAILAEGRAYYVIGVERPPDRRDRRDQDVKIEVSRKGIRLSFMRKYAAQMGDGIPRVVGLPSTLSSSLVSAVSGVLPVQTLPLDATVAAFGVSGSDTAAVIVVTGARLNTGGAVPPALSSTRSIHVLTGAWDRNGKPVAMQHRALTLGWPTSTEAESTYSETEIVSRLSLKPGQYEIRVAIEDDSTGKQGSVYTYVDVPDFAKDRLSLSGLLVGASPAPTLIPKDLTHDLLPIFPTGERQFSGSSIVVALVRVYQGVGRAPADVKMSATVVGIADRPVISEVTTLPAGRFTDNLSADYMMQIPVEDLAPGRYLLALEAALGDQRMVRRAQFEVK